jgi:hypothetical protein
MINGQLYVKIKRARSPTLARWCVRINRRKWPRELRQWETTENSEAMDIMRQITSELGWRWIQGKLPAAGPAIDE